jgi:hypothetical protein
VLGGRSLCGDRKVNVLVENATNAFIRTESTDATVEVARNTVAVHVPDGNKAAGSVEPVIITHVDVAEGTLRRKNRQ